MQFYILLEKSIPFWSLHPWRFFELPKFRTSFFFPCYDFIKCVWTRRGSKFKWALLTQAIIVLPFVLFAIDRWVGVGVRIIWNEQRCKTVHSVRYVFWCFTLNCCCNFSFEIAMWACVQCTHTLRCNRTNAQNVHFVRSSLDERTKERQIYYIVYIHLKGEMK